jgi:hypothetical protein
MLPSKERGLLQSVKRQRQAVVGSGARPESISGAYVKRAVKDGASIR